MGQIQSLAGRMSSAMQSIGELSDPLLSTRDIFQAMQLCDANELSDMLDECQFDMTTLDEANGETILHHAMTLRRDDITAMLLLRAQHDPAVLNTPDRQGYTPLIRATAMRDVDLMLSIVNAGGGTGDNSTLADMTVAFARSEKEHLICMALMLIEAQGDLSKAFEFAVQYRKPDAAKAYFQAGARILTALQRGTDAIKWISDCRCLRADDVLAVLEEARQSGDAMSTIALTRSERVLLALDSVEDRSDANIAELLKDFIRAGADIEDLLSLAASRYVNYKVNGKALDVRMMMRHIGIGRDDAAVVRQLIRVGASAIPELVWRNDRKDAFIIKMLIGLGADALGAMRALKGSDTGLISRPALNHVLQQQHLPQADRLSQLKTLMRAGAADEAENLARDLINRSGSFDDLRLLMLAIAHPSDKLLMSIVRAARHAELRRASANEPEHSPQRQLVRQLIHSGVDFSEVVAQLCSDRYVNTAIINDYCHVRRLPPSERSKLLQESSKIKIPQEALNLIMYALLQDVLSKTSLSHTEKIAQLKKLMAHEAMPAAGELLRDAVNAGHSATMKLLVLAEVPAAAAFVHLGRKLVMWEESAHIGAQQLIRLGADYQPAMRELHQNIQAYTQKGEHASATREQDALNALGRVIAMELAPRGPSNSGGTMLPERAE